MAACWSRPNWCEDLIAFFQPKLLAGQHVLVTAGPTYEAIDPVRGITNLSSGKMGFAVARAAQRGRCPGDPGGRSGQPADTARRAPHRRAVGPRDVGRDAGAGRYDATLFVATAAVADWRPGRRSRAQDQEGRLGPDAAAAVRREPGHSGDGGAVCRARKHGALFCVGFAAESQDLLANAQAKRVRKGVPLLVGNIGPATFGQDDNALAAGRRPTACSELARAPKLALARTLIS